MNKLGLKGNSPCSFECNEGSWSQKNEHFWCEQNDNEMHHLSPMDSEMCQEPSCQKNEEYPSQSDRGLEENKKMLLESNEVYLQIIEAQKKGEKNREKNPHNNPKRRFTTEEDEEVIKLLQKYGLGQYLQHLDELGAFPFGEKRIKARVRTHLRPGLNRERFTEEEDHTLLQLVVEHGQKWAELAEFFSDSITRYA